MHQKGLRTFAANSNTDIMNNQLTIKRLQNEAKHFLTETKLILNGISILPKEIEVYYYKEGEFEDPTVHRNELQQNNKNHFYVHRWGKTKNDKYKGGNRAGMDFVVSSDVNTYYSYLIRSAEIDGNLIVGPNKVLKTIEVSTDLSYKELESNIIDLEFVNSSYDVLFSERINLNQEYEFSFYELRAVLCDSFYRDSKYRFKERMITQFIKAQKMPQTQALKYANDKLGYVPAEIRSL